MLRVRRPRGGGPVEPQPGAGDPVGAEFRGESVELEKKTMSVSLLLPEGTDIGEISDGFHTFNELHRHRQVLFCKLLSAFPDISWKSWKHADGTMFNVGWFVAGMNLPTGQITYNMEARYFDAAECTELDFAPELDGHTADDVLHRLECWKGLK